MGRHRAQSESEEDVQDDPHVAASRDSADDNEYVGRTASDDALDAGETGAEARSTDG